MGRGMRVSSIVLALAMLAGCSSSSTPPSPFAVVPGPTPTVYGGSIQDSVSGAGTLRLILSTAAGVTGGTWSATFNGRTEPTLIVTAVAANGLLTGTVHPEVTDNGGSSGCTSSMTATLSASGISGTYSTFAVTRTCPTPKVGSFTVTRQ